jgi:hypothetical protein
VLHLIHLESIMESSRFSILLIALLSCSLGIALSSGPAIGYPAGAAVSHGTNPVRSGSGSMGISSDATSSATLLSSTDQQQLIITDVLIGFVQQQNHCRGSGEARIVGSDGATYANIPVYSTTLGNASSHATQISTQSGFVIPQNTTVHVQWYWGWNECSRSDFQLAYNLTGYLSTP